MLEQQIQATLQRHDDRVRDLEVRMGQQDVINHTEEESLTSLVGEMSNLREDFTAFGILLAEINVTVNSSRPNGRRGQLYEKAKIPVEAGVILTLLGLLAERLLS